MTENSQQGVLPFALPLHAYMAKHGFTRRGFAYGLTGADPSTWWRRADNLIRGTNTLYLDDRRHTPLAVQLSELYGFPADILFPLHLFNNPEGFVAHWAEIAVRLDLGVPEMRVAFPETDKTPQEFDNICELLKSMVREEFGFGKGPAAAERLYCPYDELRDYMCGKRVPDKSFFYERIASDGKSTTRYTIMEQFRSRPVYRANLDKHINGLNANNISAKREKLTVDKNSAVGVFIDCIGIVFGKYGSAARALGRDVGLINHIAKGDSKVSKYFLCAPNHKGNARIDVLINGAIALRNSADRRKAFYRLAKLGQMYDALPLGKKIRNVRLLSAEEMQARIGSSIKASVALSRTRSKSDKVAVLQEKIVKEAVKAKLEKIKSEAKAKAKAKAKAERAQAREEARAKERAAFRDYDWCAVAGEILYRIVYSYAAPENEIDWQDEIDSIKKGIVDERTKSCFEAVLSGRHTVSGDYVNAAIEVVKAYYLHINYGNELLSGLYQVGDEAAELSTQLGRHIPEVRSLVDKTGKNTSPLAKRPLDPSNPSAAYSNLQS